jgi:hypothetical protein
MVIVELSHVVGWRKYLGAKAPAILGLRFAGLKSSSPTEVGGSHPKAKEAAGRRRYERRCLESATHLAPWRVAESRGRQECLCYLKATHEA